MSAAFLEVKLAGTPCTGYGRYFIYILCTQKSDDVLKHVHDSQKRYNSLNSSKTLNCHSKETRAVLTLFLRNDRVQHSPSLVGRRSVNGRLVAAGLLLGLT